MIKGIELTTIRQLEVLATIARTGMVGFKGRKKVYAPYYDFGPDTGIITTLRHKRLLSYREPDRGFDIWVMANPRGLAELDRICRNVWPEAMNAMCHPMMKPFARSDYDKVNWSQWEKDKGLS